MAKSKIEWTEYSWNPVMGCDYHHWSEEVRFHLDVLREPLSWRKPRRVFVCSMSDLFRYAVPAEFIRLVYEVMQEAEQHTFIVCTKRSHQLVPMLHGELGNWYFDGGDYLPNVWHLTTAENQGNADWRIPPLLKLRDKSPGWPVLGVSVEPMLAPVDLSRWIDRLDWVIAGCETGPNRRPAEIDWFRSLRDQCQAAKVPFFLKQAEINGRVVKMPELDGRVWDETPGTGGHNA